MLADAISNDPIPSSSPVQAGGSSLPSSSNTQSFARTANEILTPEMNDIEKLQKIKEWILQDQHPYFNSAPKVAHLLSLRVSAADQSSSGSAGDRDVERPISSIPLAERLSSPRDRINGDFRDSQSQEAHEAMSTSAEDRAGGQGNQNMEQNVNANATPIGEDVDMTDSHGLEPTGPVLTPTHPTGRGIPHPRGAYSRPMDTGWKQEKYIPDQGRRSPGADGRPRDDYEWRRHPGDDPMRRPPSPTGRYEKNYDRFEPGSHAPGYHPQGNRRFSYGDRQRMGYAGDRDYANQGSYAPRFQDDRRMDDRGYTRHPMAGPRTQNYHANRGNYERPMYGTNRQQSQHIKNDSFDQSTSNNGLDSQLVNSAEPADDKEVAKSEPPSESKVTPANASPVSPAVAPSQSGTDSVPAPPSPVKSETPQEVPFVPAPDEKMSEGNHSPRVSASAVEDRDVKQPEPEQQDNRPKFYQGRPRMNFKYPHEHHGYDRSLPPRDDRNFERREAYQRPGYAHPLPSNDRRFVQREAAYPDDSPYASRREFQPQNWDMKRRDDDLSFTKPFDYDRGRDFRAGPVTPRDMPPRDMRDRKGPPMGAVRSYDFHHEVPRRLVSRSPPPRPLSPPPGFRDYDRNYYAAPAPPAMAPMAASYSRELPRVRPRSLSPVRRDFRAEERPPPAKRPRGPAVPYAANTTSGQYFHLY